jgi:hypothetical protein
MESLISRHIILAGLAQEFKELSRLDDPDTLKLPEIQKVVVTADHESSPSQKSRRQVLVVVGIVLHRQTYFSGVSSASRRFEPGINAT